MHLDRAVAALASRQQGLVTRAQARRIGLSEAACDRRVLSGGWERVHRGVYRLAGVPETWEQTVRAACLALPGAVASHRAAGTLLGLPGFDRRVEVTVLSYHRPLAGVSMHRAVCLERADRDRHEGSPSPRWPGR